MNGFYGVDQRFNRRQGGMRDDVLGRIPKRVMPSDKEGRDD